MGDLPLRYDPTGEWIFPSLFEMTGVIANPRAPWYMYYSPHECPGGICLALGDSPSGPWREYERNPVIKNHWPPNHVLTHVASPHPFWHRGEQRLFLFYHGENDATRYASSEDGIHFRYEGVAIEAKELEDISECSYARVFNVNLNGHNKFLMLFMGNNRGIRRIYAAWSKNCREWEIKEEPVVSAPGQSLDHACSPFLHVYKYRWYILYHCDEMNGAGNIYAAEVDKELRQISKSFIVYEAEEGIPDFRRAADPFLVVKKDRMQIVYCCGERLRGKIGLLEMDEGLAV